jgi:DNA topoisomerase I
MQAMATKAAATYEWCPADALVYVDDHGPGLTRVGTMTGWTLRDPDGRAVRDPLVAARVRALVIPPAWTDVWICPDPDGHLQVTGRDAKGRKQYRYHPAYRAHREQAKFDGLAEFGAHLGRLRRRVDDDLALPGLPEAKVLALVVRLLEETAVRVGNEEYARTNGSYGLTTLRNRHARWEHGGVTFRFPGKSGKIHQVTLDDRRLVRAVRRCQELPGQLLLQYVDDETGAPTAVTSCDVNDYLRGASGIDVTAKDFRTWIGTVDAAELLAAAAAPTSPREAAQVVREAVAQVAERLGNTVAVCRSSYVHPLVIETYEAGRLADVWEAGPRRAAGGLTASERRLLALLEPRRRRRPHAVAAA